MKTEPIEQEQPEKKPAADAEVQKQFDQLDGLLLDFKPEPEPEAESQSDDAVPGHGMDTGEMCSALFNVIFTLMASRRGDHWMLSDAEGEMLGNALAAVLDKYMPGVKGGPEATLIVVVLLLVGPRAMADRQIKKVQASKPEKTGKREQVGQKKEPEQKVESGRGEGFDWIKEAA